MFEGRWFWCGLCQHQAIKCEHCGNTSCNGSGCDLCQEDFEQASKILAEGKAPAKETIPYHPAPDWDKLFGKQS